MKKNNMLISFENLEILKYESEEYHCLHMWLDDMGVPTHDPDNNQRYSSVGRVISLLKLSGEKVIND